MIIIAYAARSLAGMIHNVGLLPCELISKKLRKAYALYRRRDRKSHPRDPGTVEFRRKYQCHEPTIRFLGCFDTVGLFIIIPNLKNILQTLIQLLFCIQEVSECLACHGIWVELCASITRKSFHTISNDTYAVWSVFHNLSSFHDTKISPQIISSYHALAIHGQRAWFSPTLMIFTSRKQAYQQWNKSGFPVTTRMSLVVHVPPKF